MAIMTASEARTHLPELLDRVEAGEEITITRHGKPAVVVLRHDAVRVRRARRAYAEAEKLHAELEHARRRPLRSVPGITREFAEELIAEIRSDRDTR
ncbi:MAG: type II toxin-antitoxin system Phd/YefM family antitoxin [Acidimicrobiales bacterium]